MLPPLYTVVVAAAFALFGDASALAIASLQLLNAVATTAIIAFVYSTALTLGGPRCAWLAALLAAFNPLLIGFSGFVWDTCLFALGVTMTIWLAVRLAHNGRGLWPHFAFGLWLGALALLNPALTIAYPLLVLGPAKRSPARPISRSCAALAGWVLILAPWAVRNYQQFGTLTYVRAGLWHEVWMGACPDAETNPKAVYKTTFLMGNPILQKHAAEMGEVAYIAECGRLARDAIAADPTRYVKLCAIRFIDFWLGTLRSHSEPPFYRWLPRSPMRLAIAAFLTAETAIIVVGAVRLRQKREYLWLVGIAALFSAAYVLIQVMLRYRLPIEPLLAIVVGFVLTQKSSADQRFAA
jgi:4-amino-4-deoxy-L-arabinose transferase-like glycosyltransferase